LIKLKWNQLKYFYEPTKVDKTPKNSQPFGLIGQNRAIQALSLGLTVKSAGYNIFVAGEPGVGRNSFAKKLAKQQAKTEPTPPDLLYVYNFANPKSPKLLTLPAGEGRVLKKYMADFLQRIKHELPKIFASKDFETKKNSILKIYNRKKDEIIRKIAAEAKEQSLAIKITNMGIYFLPIINGETLAEDQYDELTHEQWEIISQNSETIQKKSSEAMHLIKETEKIIRKNVDNLEYSTGLFAVGHYMATLMSTYADQPTVLSYLKAVKEDILDNITDFISDEQEEEENAPQYAPWQPRKPAEDIYNRYRINLLTEHKPNSGAPVVVSINPTYTNLIGEIEYDNEHGNLSTDFTKITSGLLHDANGGYLILQAQDILRGGWDGLRNALKRGKIKTETSRDYNNMTISEITPEPVPLNVKIIIIGDMWYYDLLCEIDDYFEKFFKIRVDFDDSLKTQHVQQVANFINEYAKTVKKSAITPKAVAILIEHAARLAERQDRITASFGKLTDIINEALVLVAQETHMNEKTADPPKIAVKHIETAIKNQIYRLNMYEEDLVEMIEDGSIMIDTAGEKVGQINGLSVIDTGDYAFSKPSKITATTYMGKSGIVNIEKEAEMSGSIHDKGIQVLIGYLGQTYAQDFPLTLSCRIGFEQNYGGIDGDSASSTELYAVLSSLADLPIRQDIAVTGSINQFGDIQPIGGVTYKIEGFFDLCAKRGLTGTQGVIIPHQNIRDLVLKDEVITAVKAEKFSIYAIKHINEGIEILTGHKAGKPDKNGRYEVNSVHNLVLKKLRSYHKKVMKSE